MERFVSFGNSLYLTFNCFRCPAGISKVIWSTPLFVLTAFEIMAAISLWLFQCVSISQFLQICQLKWPFVLTLLLFYKKDFSSHFSPPINIWMTYFATRCFLVFNRRKLFIIFIPSSWGGLREIGKCYTPLRLSKMETKWFIGKHLSRSQSKSQDFCHPKCLFLGTGFHLLKRLVQFLAFVCS